MSERRFTDEEVALILREASEVGDEGGRARPDGLSLAQLKEIAVEVGLDPTQVEAAANRRIHHRAGGRVPFFGTPVAPEFEREIPGDLAGGDVPELVTTIRKILGRRGITGTELGSFEWKAGDPMGGRYVSVRHGGGSTKLRVFGNFRDGMGLVSLGGGLGILTAFAALLTAMGAQDLVGAGVVPLGALLALLPTRALWRWLYRREEDALADLTEALDAQIRTLVEKKRLGAATTDPERPALPGGSGDPA